MMYIYLALSLFFLIYLISSWIVYTGVARILASENAKSVTKNSTTGISIYPMLAFAAFTSLFIREILLLIK